jgi:hypothetical protein
MVGVAAEPIADSTKGSEYQGHEGALWRPLSVHGMSVARVDDLMLIVGYCYGILFERKLCEEVELHLAYRRFCRLYLDDKCPDHSTYCAGSPLKPRCWSNTPSRKVMRDLHEDARGHARTLVGTPEFDQFRNERKQGRDALCPQDPPSLRAGRLRVSGERGDEAFDLGLGVADDAGAHFVIHCFSRAAQWCDEHGKKR